MKATRLSLLIILLASLISLSHTQIRDFVNDIIENAGDAVEEFIGNIDSIFSVFESDLGELVDRIQDANLSNLSTIGQTIAIMDIFNEVDIRELCNDCEEFVRDFRRRGDEESVQNTVRRGYEELCQRRFDANLCSQSAQAYGQIIIDSILFEGVSPTFVCQKFGACPYTTDQSTLRPYVDDVTENKPAPNVPTPTNQSTYRVLHLTDVHIDFLYEQGTNAFCGSVQCCRAVNGPPSNPADAAGYWGSLGTCDIPYRTFDQFVQFANSTLNVSKIIWTGDNIDHAVFEQSQQNQTYPTFNITEHLLQYFPNMSVTPMFGNHEAFPSDQYDTLGTDSEWLTQELGEMWDTWLDDQALSSFTTKSYFSEVDTERNLKIISLDTQTCDTLNFYLVRDDSLDPLGQLAWLETELADAEANNQSVWIMGHIPPGNLNCDPQWSERYRALVDRYSNTIRAQFFGHTHTDEFQVVRSFEDDSPVGVMYVAPSLTTYVGQNPSFRVYEIDAETNQAVNYYQYRLNLTKWNENTTGPLEWDIAYNFLEEYNLPDMSFASFDSLADQIRSNETVADIYASNFNSGAELSPDLDQRETDYLYCYAKYSTPEAIVSCLGLDPEKTNIMYFATLAVPSIIARPGSAS